MRCPNCKIEKLPADDQYRTKLVKNAYGSKFVQYVCRLCRHRFTIR